MDVEDFKDRRLIFNNMKGILTPEEKKYLQRTSNYLGSYGMTSGSISFEMDEYDSTLNVDEINFDRIKTFDNNYSVEVLPQLIQIIRKVIYHVDELNPELDYGGAGDDDITYQEYDFIIDTVHNDISVTHSYSYYGRGSGHSIMFDSDDDKARFDRWMENEMSEIEVPEDGILRVSFNGGGDSGYLDSDFYPTHDAVPAAIEDWCYNELESNYGGWEINEGSDGDFIFDFNNSTVELNLTYNEQFTVTNTLYEESFG